MVQQNTLYCHEWSGSVTYKTWIQLVSGFICFGYNYDKLESSEIASSTAFNYHWQFTRKFLWDQMDQLFFLAQPNGFAG
jgi:hypothetical protein